MRKKISVLFILLLFCCLPDFSRGECRVSVFINPLKPFIGLLNIGVECQFESQYSVHLSVEYALFRSGYLDRISHPDFVGSMGFRHYFSLDQPDASGTYSGILCGYTRSGREEKSTRVWDIFIGTEVGYRFLLDNSGYISPRGLITFPLRSRKILPGAEALFGKIL